ncbi:hillarin-like [Ylistrum balloti]|uniref:hillarin-like n=1 Tax=Ylistrum balloti TaxID=509963 RepID=UPI002905C92F|nr:hillarin-like [Ylistrum balloti]
MSRHHLGQKRSSKLLRQAVSKERRRESSPNFRQVFLDVDTEPGYPGPAPPEERKKEFFDVKDFSHVDNYVRKAPQETGESYEALLKYLINESGSDLERIRALFYWLILQKVPMLLCQKDIPSPDTPVGYLHLVRERKGSYSEMFTTLSRKAGIPCVTIHGIAKGVAYDVGEKIDRIRMKNSWNAVYLEGGWRFVHPYWAAMSAQGYNTGRWTVVECPEFHEDFSPKGGSKSYIVHSMVNEFFFLTDPDQFITKCFPNDERWQLLRTPFTKEAFEATPFLQPSFYELGLKLTSHKKCVVQSRYGKVKIAIEMPEDCYERLQFAYKLYRSRECEDEGEYEYFKLERFVLQYCQGTTALTEIRFPPVATGAYKLELHCRDPKHRLISEWICDFKVICTNGMEVCEPLPVVPSIGWGAGPELERHNIVARTHTDGVYNVDEDLVTEVWFEHDDETEIYTELVHNSLSKSELAECLSQTFINEDSETVVRIKPPSEGEYALQVFSKKKDALNLENVYNVLLQRTQVVENASMAELREQLRMATTEGDTRGMASLLDECSKRGLEDKGDFTKAKRKFLLNRLNNELKEAMESKDLEKLDTAMHNLSETSLKKELGSLLEDAEVMRIRLRKLKRLRKAVLEMDAKSISEIRSYPKPPAAVHAVMAATFLLLGSKEADLRKWPKVQGLISKKGKDGLKRRVAAFQIKKLRPAIVIRAKEIISKYDMETVQIASAGAATFYQWATTTIHDYET